MKQTRLDSAGQEPADLIATAIEAEKKAAWFYRTMADMTSDTTVRSTLERLSDDESSHARTLSVMYVEITGHQVEHTPASSVEGGPEPFDFPATSRRAALEFALRNELKAAELYQSQADSCGEPRRAAIYRRLAKTEREHAATLRIQLGLPAH